MKETKLKNNPHKKKPFIKPEAKVTKIALGVWAGSCSGSCLSPNTKISTPNGEVFVKNLKKGDSVYTQDSQGRKITVSILKTSRVFVSSSHKMVNLAFDRDQFLIASPDHPAIGTKKVRELFPGENYDGSKIKQVSLVDYDQTHTYDILPAGDTGYYWANGILLGSTLFPEEISPIAKIFTLVEVSQAT